MSLLSRFHILASIVLTAQVMGSAGHAGDSWTQFQGRPGESFEIRDLPLQWSPTENIDWKISLVGYGQSSPVVWKGKVFVTSVSGPMKETCHVAAYDLDSGERLWERDFAAASQAENSSYISKAAPTPIVDPSGVTAFFEGGNLLALTHDGELRWERDLVAEYGAIGSRHGLGASLEQDAERIFVWVERSEDPYVLAISKATGETIWKQEGLGVTSWSSPRLVSVEETHHLVLSGIGSLAGLDPQSGQRLWSFDEISGNSTPTPVPLGGGRFLIGATTGDREAGGGNAAASNGVIRIAKQEDGSFEADWVWQATRATSSFGSPVAHRGFAYFVNRAGVVYCLDLETGEEQYAERSSGSVWATPIAIDDRLYLFDKSGGTTVIQAGPTFEVLAENRLWAEEGRVPRRDGPGAQSGPAGGTVIYAAVAVDGQWLVRGGDVLYSIAGDNSPSE